MKSPRLKLLAACAGVIGLANMAGASIVINEFQYDDLVSAGGNDIREFVELYNNGAGAVDISGWTVGGRDQPGLNTVAIIPASTSIPAGGYYVIGNSGLANVNQVVATGFLENDAETIELRDGPFATGTLQDAVVYEANKGTGVAPHPVTATGYGTLPADVAANINAGGNANSPGYWGNSQSTANAGAVSASIGRYSDGVDTNNNGRDFGIRPGTPGASNAAGGSVVVNYSPANVDSLATHTDAPGLRASFTGTTGDAFYTPVAGAKVIDPTVVSTANPNAIPASPQGGKAITVVDTSGGGNAAMSIDTFQGNGGIALFAYLDTTDIGAAEHETTTYGTHGSVGALFNIGDPEGDIAAATAPGSAGDNSGVAWFYQKFGTRAKLYLIDALDGGNSSPDVTPVEWAILKSYDLSSAASAWHELSINITAAGVGVATFDGDVTNFNTAANLAGEFYVGYREAIAGNPTAGGIHRPATFDMIPEPASLSLLALGGLGALRRHRRA